MSQSVSSPAAGHDDDQTVYTTVSRNRTQRSGTEKIFHTDRGCFNLQKTPGNIQAHPRHQLINGWRECKDCSGQKRKRDANKRIPCPFCDEAQQNLPLHMRGCDG